MSRCCGECTQGFSKYFYLLSLPCSHMGVKSTININTCCTLHVICRVLKNVSTTVRTVFVSIMLSPPSRISSCCVGQVANHLGNSHLEEVSGVAAVPLDPRRLTDARPTPTRRFRCCGLWVTRITSSSTYCKRVQYYCNSINSIKIV